MMQLCTATSSLGVRLFCKFLLNHVEALCFWKGIDLSCFYLLAVAPSGVICQLHFGTFHYKSNQGTCDVPRRRESTFVVDLGENQWVRLHLFTKANFDI